MLVSDFDFELPEELIAQHPPRDRADARMMRLSRETGAIESRIFRGLPELLRPDDLLVFNNTRVFPARLLGRRSGNKAQKLSEHNPAMREFLQGKVEALLTRRLTTEGASRETWQALVRPGRKIGVGEQLVFSHPQAGAEADELAAEVIARGEFGERTLRFDAAGDFFLRVERIGHIPLPPYIRHGDDQPEDRERYQTVYARATGSAAAPTAGLHFTSEVLERIRERGIETAEVTLHVGLGTFQPLRHEQVEENKLHLERYSIGEEAAAAINRAKSAGRRIVAVGTTTVRTLEFAAQENGEVRAGSGDVDIFIYPGFRFRVIDVLLTNFHLPKSSLLMLVAAFAGRENVLSAYRRAVKERYRFFSYGDCMLLE